MSTQDSLFGENDPGQKAGSSGSNPFPAAAGGSAGLENQLAVAERRMGTLSVFLLLVSGTLAIFLLQQIRYSRADLRTLDTSASELAEMKQFIQSYRETAEPVQHEFIKQLVQFAQGHPSVVPILLKHRVGKVERVERDPGAERAGSNP